MLRGRMHTCCSRDLMSSDAAALTGSQWSVSTRPSGYSLATAFSRHAAFVFRSLRRLGVERESAEDATQEVFVIAIRRWHTFDRRGPVRSWLFGIARRVASHHRRARTRAQVRTERTHSDSLTRGSPLEPDAAMARREAGEFLEHFCDSLSDRVRPVFVGMELEQMSASEVASALGITPSAAYGRLQTARAKLQLAVAAREQEPK